jgi:hypothetical protein
MFFRKNSPIVLNCYTHRQELIDAFPVSHTQKHIPKWWKNLPKTGTSKNGEIHSPTMRTCTGFVDYYTNGFTIPLWTDLLFTVNEKAKSLSDGVSWQNADDTTRFDVHPAYQRGSYLPEDKYQHLKLLSPWLIECKEDVKFVQTGNTWAFDDPAEVLIPPAILGYNYQASSHINMFLVYSQELKKIYIPAGTAMVNIVPMSDRPLVIKHHLLSKQDFESKERALNYKPSFLGSVGKMMKFKKEASTKSKCPFGFGS